MAARPPVPLCIQVRPSWEIGGDFTAENVLHYLYTGTAPTSAACTAIAATVCSNLAAHVQGLQGANVLLQGCTVLDLASSTGAQGFSPTGYTGSRTGTTMPASVCGNVGFTIANRYRGGKPKMFLPCGVQADTNSSQIWTGAFVTAVSAGVTTALAANIGFSVSGCTVAQQVAVSYYQGYNTPTTSPSGRVRQSPKLRVSPITYPISASILRSRIGSQRRRLGKPL